MLTEYGVNFLNGLWTQIAAGFVITPCVASSAANLISLTPLLHEEGGASYGSGMAFWLLADATSTGLVTARVKRPGSATDYLSTAKVLKSDGAAQATTGDIVSGSGYLFIYDPALDGGAGAFIMK